MLKPVKYDSISDVSEPLQGPSNPSDTNSSLKNMD